MGQLIEVVASNNSKFRPVTLVDIKEIMNTLRRVTLGSRVRDKLSILSMVVLQSVPNVIRKSICILDDKIDKITAKLCWGIIIKTGNIRYFLLDYPSLVILSSEFESFGKAWLRPRRREVFVDIGAHIGKYALPIAKFVGNEGIVVAIEPHPMNFQILQRNIAMNKLQNVVALKLIA